MYLKFLLRSIGCDPGHGSGGDSLSRQLYIDRCGTGGQETLLHTFSFIATVELLKFLSWGRFVFLWHVLRRMGWQECCPASNGLVEAGVMIRYP